MRKSIYFVFIVLIALTVGIGCFFNEQLKPESEVFLNHDPKVLYVGKEVCKGCHPDIYASFIETGMGKSWGLATKSKTSARFTNKAQLYDTLKNLYYNPYWDGDTLKVLEFRLSGKDTIHQRTENIKYIVGSGQHTNSHIIETNGFLYQAPLTFYTQKGTWNLPPGFEAGNNSRFSRPIELECMTCHNALPEFDNQSQNRYNQVESGLSCERCHGPGSLHVAEKQKGNIIDTRKDTDFTIVNPSKLSWQLQIDVCQRCHLQGNAVLQTGKSFTDFRPGMPLHEVMDVYMPRFSGDDSKFIMASHAERLQKSNCFIQSNKESKTGQQTLKLTCINCHNPHVSVKVTGKEVYNVACNKCHQEKICTAKPAILKAEKNNCVKCHMPSGGTTDIPHVSVHDHYIRRPATNNNVASLQQFLGITCVNNPAPSAASKIEGYLNYYEKFDASQISSLDSAFMLLSKNQVAPELWIHYYYLRKEYSNIILWAGKLNVSAPIDCWTSYRIAESYIKNNDFKLAETWINKSVGEKPAQLNFLLKLGFVKYNLGDISGARKVLENIITLNPKYPEAYSSLGLIWCNQGKGDLKEALRLYDKALNLDPDLESALINSLDIFNVTGDTAKFISYLKRLYKISPQNKKLQPMYEEFLKSKR